MISNSLLRAQELESGDLRARLLDWQNNGPESEAKIRSGEEPLIIDDSCMGSMDSSPRGSQASDAFAIARNDFEGSDDLRKMTATSFVTVDKDPTLAAEPTRTGKPEQRSGGRGAGASSKRQSADQLKATLWTMQQVRLLLGLVQDSTGLPLAIWACQAALLVLKKYSDQVHNNPGHGLGSSAGTSETPSP